MKWIISALFLLLVSCTKNEIDMPTEYTEIYKGNVIISLRDYSNPVTDTDVITVHDTQYAQVIVNVDLDSIHFISDNSRLPKHSAAIADSMENGNYMVYTYRPMSHYKFNGDTLKYYSNATSPIGGPYMMTIIFTGLKM